MGAHPAHQRRWHQRRRVSGAGEDRARAFRRRLGGRARDRAVRREPCADAQRAAPRPPAGRAPLRRRRHARPTASLLALMELIDGPQARPCALRRQPGRQRRRGRDHSGTVAGAIEGMALGVPSIALRPDLEARRGAALRHRGKLRACPRPALVAVGWPAGVIMNVNFPDCPPEEVTGVEVTRQASRARRGISRRRKDLRGRHYYWLGHRIRRNRRMAPTCRHL